jgi:spore coat protein B
MSNENNLSYLLSLTGRKVRTYKGGPESKEGQLLHVKKDYIALLSDDNEVIYYQTNHLKSVVEDTKASFQTMAETKEEDTSHEVLESDSFKEILKLMQYQNVQIDRGGPDSLKGKLLDVKNDFLTLQSENNGVVFYQIHHIKSVSVVNSSSEENSNSNDQASVEVSVPAEEVSVPAENFSDLLSGYQHSWVTINRGGPESVEGVLAGMTNDYVTVIHHEKVHRITNYHIRNISHGTKHGQKQQESNNQSNEENNENQTVNQNSMDEQNTQNNSEQDKKQKNKQESKQNDEKTKKEQVEKQTVVNENSSKNNNKKVLYEMLMKQVSVNLEDALKRAQSRITN